MPKLTIIVPTYNRAPFLVATIDQLLEQEFRDSEIWVIDQSSEDQSAIIQRRLDGWMLDHRYRDGVLR